MTGETRAVELIRASSETGRVAETVVVEESDTSRDIPGVRDVDRPREGRGFGHARNVGVRAARSEILVFVDDDCEVSPHWLDGLIAPLRANRDILGFAGAVLVRDCGLLGYAESILGFPGGRLRYPHQARGKVVTTRYLSTCDCAYRRDAVIGVGGFAEDAARGCARPMRVRTARARLPSAPRQVVGDLPVVRPAGQERGRVAAVHHPARRRRPVRSAKLVDASIAASRGGSRAVAVACAVPPGRPRCLLCRDPVALPIRAAVPRLSVLLVLKAGAMTLGRRWGSLKYRAVRP